MAISHGVDDQSHAQVTCLITMASSGISTGGSGTSSTRRLERILVEALEEEAVQAHLVLSTHLCTPGG